MRRRTAAKKPPTDAAPRRKKARPRRPSSLDAALDALNAEHRPPFVPEDALLLAAWAQVPSDNQQRDQHWMLKRAWQEPVINDFSACMAEYPHPGVLEGPRVHILLLVPRRGDEKNRSSRAKFVIDRLQVKREVEYKKPLQPGQPQAWGVRTYGLLGLIQDDAVLTDATCTIDEQPVKITADDNPCKVLMWVWDDPPPAF